MANFVPWGSASSATFWGPLRSVDPDLVKRLVGFSDELNVAITLALRPRLLVIPLSLARAEELRDTEVRLAYDEATPYTIALGKRTFRYAAGRIRRGEHTWPAAFLPHPASLHYSVPDRLEILARLPDGLRAAMT